MAVVQYFPKEFIPPPYYPNRNLLITSKKVEIESVPSFMQKFSK